MMNSRRQTLRLPKPAVQLKLPLLLLAVTLVFGAIMAWHTHAAYERFFATTLSSVSDSFQEDVQKQTADYAVASAAILGGYALMVLGLCIGYTHSLIGPTVALQRQVRKLRNGDYTARTRLRRSDTVFTELAGDLNAVAEMLQKHAGEAGAAQLRG
jgi:nitrate/nitrite-specific signal transduction histidine kinase